MAACLAPNDVRRMHQSLHHLVADAPWNDEEMLAEVRRYVLPTMQKQGSVVAWIVDDTGFPKQGKHSVGVARQYCGQLGKSDNCQTVSLSVSTWHSSLPMAWRLYLPEVWCQDVARCQQAGVPEGVAFQTKPEIALEQIRQAMEQQVPAGVVLADAGYGKGTQFRTDLTQLGLEYVVGIESNATVWEPGQQPLPALPTRKLGRGAPPKRLKRSANHQPISVKELALGLPSSAWREIGWRQGSEETLRSRFAAVRVRPAHRDYKRTAPYPEEWLLVEWPKKESEPTKYWLSTLPAKMSLKSLVKIAKHRWIIERDYEELKQELGLGHYEGRGWRGFHHHATLCIAAYGFLISEQKSFSPSARVGNLELSAPEQPPDFRPRGSPRSPRTT
jgi:SRSO17 transposase